MRAWAVVCLCLLGGLGRAGTAQAQGVPDLRAAHAMCARSMVRIEGMDDTFGSGWVVELAGHRYVVTNAHVVRGQTDLWVWFDGSAGSLGTIAYLSTEIDLALIEVVGPIPVEPLRFVSGHVVRGERVVIGGNAGVLSFITTEGVIAGFDAGTEVATAACGTGNECLVLDAEAEPGYSGGPVVDHEGNVIGMMWGVYTGASFSIAIPASRLAEELMSADRVLLARSHH
jgi:S1-C subfamily serine protease